MLAFKIASLCTAAAILTSTHLSWSTFAAETAPANDDFISIFDGRTLNGWLGQDMSFWSVEDGAITGSISTNHAPRMNQYLIWQHEALEDFELKLQFRFTACSGKSENSGFQYRSRRLPNWDVAGYQVDNNFGTPWKVRLYDEHGRHDLALEGEQTVFDASGQKHTTKLALDSDATNFRLDDWHDYDLLAQGPHLVLRINGHLVSEAFDNDPQNFEPAGILGLQLHTGPPMKVQFRNILYKRLPPARALSPRDRLTLEAVLHWRLGNRIPSFQPPLKPIGQLTTGVKSSAPAGSELVARFEKAFFSSDTALNEGRTWNVRGKTMTLFARVRASNGRWDAALLTKGGSPRTLNFNFAGTGTGENDVSSVSFRIRTESGSFAVTSPALPNPAGWHNLLGRYDGQQIELFCDGKVLASQPATGELRRNDDPFLVGAEMIQGKPAHIFSGEMAEAGVWDRSLSNEEVQLLENDRSAAP